MTTHAIGGSPAAGDAPRTNPWPEGVTARYLTVGGATVDLTGVLTLPPDPILIATRATCTGCPETKEVSHYRTYYSSGGWLDTAVEEHEPDVAEDAARTWAQEHAERCRAMARPEVDR